MRFLLLAVLGVAALPLSAQEQQVTNGQAFGDWRVNCSAQGPGQTTCLLTQNIQRAENRSLVAQIVALQTQDGSQTFISARVPTGVYFPAGFAMRAEDGGDVIPFIWQTCGQDLCEALAEMSSDTLTTLSTEGNFVLGSYRPNIRAENIVFRFSMTGILEGLAALRAARP